MLIDLGQETPLISKRTQAKVQDIQITTEMERKNLRPLILITCVDLMISIHMDSELTFSDHSTEKVNKANSLVGIIRCCFSFLDKGAFNNLVNISMKVHQYNGQIQATKQIDRSMKLTYQERLSKGFI